MSKPPAKPAPKKKGQLDEKELEAIRLEEERKKQEEERRKEEERKKEVIELPTGLILYFTQHMTEEGWKANSPLEFIKENFRRIFESRDILENFDESTIQGISEFCLHNLIFAKHDMSLDDKKATIVVNIIFRLLTCNNPLMNRKIEGWADADSRSRAEYFKAKTFKEDFAEFRRTIVNHSIENPPSQMGILSSAEAKKLLEYVKTKYFDSYNLFTYTLFNPQRKEERHIQVFIDDPKSLKPLYEAKEAHKLKSEDRHDEEREQEKRYQEQIKELQLREQEKRLEEERQRHKTEEEEEEMLEPRAQQLIQIKLKEIEAIMQKQLEEREKALNEKVSVLEPKKKK